MTNPIDSNHREINQGSKNLGRLFMQLKRLERHPHSFGSAGKLTPSEIHTIDAIGYDGAILMSELAARLNVTKGAITQLIDRLEHKGLVSRSPHPHDSRSFTISLTSVGKEAYAAHEAVHHQFYERLRSQLSEQEIKVFEKSIQILNEMLSE